jgi:hypothetical protein
MGREWKGEECFNRTCRFPIFVVYSLFALLVQQLLHNWCVVVVIAFTGIVRGEDVMDISGGWWSLENKKYYLKKKKQLETQV